MTAVIFTFSITITNFLFSQDANSSDELKKVEESGEYDYSKAIIQIESLIEKYGNDHYHNQGYLSYAYYCKSKIHFDFKENHLMELSLKKLFGIDPNYRFRDNENEKFKILAEQIREDIKRSYLEKLAIVPPAELINIPFDNLIQKEKNRIKKNILPCILIASGAVLLSLTFFLLKKSPKQTQIKTYNLTVNIGEGVVGAPATGLYTYKDGETVSYYYVLKPGYNELVMNFDGGSIPQNGLIIMDRDHTLSVSAR